MVKQQINGLSGNICSRCGKQRVIINTHKEKVGTSYVIYTETRCPDPKCQKRVDKEIKEASLRRLVTKNEQAKREIERKLRSIENRRAKV